ncbi:MAG: SDR family NAD(P)-dependent oxidoreductase, partial [Betaproteobacteria bacterium]
MKHRVLITGGANGIGKASAQRCMAEGYEVIVIDREGDGIRADLSCPNQTAEALEEALKHGPITRLLNNVGTVEAATAQEQSLAQFDRVIALNLRCAMQCTQALLPSMTEAGFGRIVSISSRAALGKTLRSAYAASKAGLIGLSRVWALELGRLGITSNVIGPGPIATELFKQANPPDS